MKAIPSSAGLPEISPTTAIPSAPTNRINTPSEYVGMLPRLAIILPATMKRTMFSNPAAEISVDVSASLMP